LTQSDDLGRVVVPKEIRRTLRIREGDPLLITRREFEKSSNNAGLEDVRRDMFLTGIIGLASRLATIEQNSEENSTFVGH